MSVDDAKVQRLTERAEVVVVAEVAEVEPTSELQPWSGLISSRQYIQYDVREILKGEVPDGKIRVRFMLVRNNLTADESRPRLSPEPFQKWNVHILLLERDRQPPGDRQEAAAMALLAVVQEL
jgi:hypothetical protein